MFVETAGFVSIRNYCRYLCRLCRLSLVPPCGGEEAPDRLPDVPVGEAVEVEVEGVVGGEEEVGDGGQEAGGALGPGPLAAVHHGDDAPHGEGGGEEGVGEEGAHQEAGEAHLPGGEAQGERGASGGGGWNMCRWRRLTCRPCCRPCWWRAR